MQCFQAGTNNERMASSDRLGCIVGKYSPHPEEWGFAHVAATALIVVKYFNFNLKLFF